MKKFLFFSIFFAILFSYSMSQIPMGNVSFGADFGYFNQAVITPDHKLGLVSDSDNDRVILFDPRKYTDNIIGSVGTGDYPMGIYLTPQGDYACVLNYGDNTVTIINLSNFDTATYHPPLPVEFTTYSNIGITPDGMYGLVANSRQDANQVFIFKISTTESNLHVATLPTGKLPVRVYINSPKNLAFVICTGKDSNDEITAINLNNFTVDSTFSVVDSDFDRNTSAGLTRNNIVFSPDGSLGFVCDSLYNDLMIFEIPNYTTQYYLDFDNLGYNLNGLSGCYISPDGNHIFCVAIVDNKIIQINSGDYSIEALYYDSAGKVRFDAFNNMVFDIDNETLYISSVGSDEILQIDYLRKKIINFLPAGDGPELIYKSTDSIYLCSLNVYSEDVSLFLLYPCEFYIPTFRNTDIEKTGYAFSNPSDNPVSIYFHLIDSDGYYVNDEPVRKILSPHNQIAFIGDQFFNLQNNMDNGWVLAISNDENIKSFFLSIDVNNNYIDGALGSNYIYTNEFFFTHVMEDYNNGIKNVETRLFLLNPTYGDVKVKLSLYDENGNILKEDEETINSGKLFTGSMKEIFYRNDTQYTVNNAYIKAQVEEGEGLYGYLRINHYDQDGNLITIHTLPIALDGGKNKLYSPHFASGGSFPLPYSTTFNIINTSTESADITFTLYAEDGNVYTNTIQDVPSMGILTLKGWQLFQLNDPSTYPDYTTGQVVITSTQDGLVGDVIFGDGGNNPPQFESSLLLDDTPYNWGVFSHVANGPIENTDLVYYTGLAISNPNDFPINVYVDAYREDGTFVGERLVSIDSNDRLIGVISNDYLIPDAANQLGGYITLYSDDGTFIAFELFTDNHGKFLSAVPIN